MENNEILDEKGAYQDDNLQNEENPQTDGSEQECPEVVLDTIESLQQKVNELNDKHIRLFAEFDNFRKRTRQEKFDLLQNASAETILALLPIMDDFERGLSNIEKANDLNSVKEGVLLIYSKLDKILKQKGLQPIESMNKPFDTDYHEAITRIEAGEDKKGLVVDEVEKGYSLNGKVIRFAKVVVGN